MAAINWLLINGTNAARWLVDVLIDALATAWGWLDLVLQPILSTLLWLLNPVLTIVGNVIYAPLGLMPAWVGLVLISAVVGVLMLIGFRYTSNQDGIGRARDRITANLLALKLFKDDFGVAVKSQRRLLGALLKLQWYMLRPVFIMLFPMVLILAQMGLRHQWRPLEPGEQTYVRLDLADEKAKIDEARLEDSPGIAEALGPVPGGGELVWRIVAGEEGRHTLRFAVNDAVVEKELVIGEPFARVSAERPGWNWTSQILHPVESPISGDAPVRHVTIQYAGVDSWIYGPNWWILTFFIVSMAFALIFKPLFKVRL